MVEQMHLENTVFTHQQASSHHEVLIRGKIVREGHQEKHAENSYRKQSRGPETRGLSETQVFIHGLLLKMHYLGINGMIWSLF